METQRGFCMATNMVVEHPLGGWKVVAMVAWLLPPGGPQSRCLMPKAGRTRTLSQPCRGTALELLSQEKEREEWAQARRLGHQSGEDTVPLPAGPGQHGFRGGLQPRCVPVAAHAGPALSVLLRVPAGHLPGGHRGQWGALSPTSLGPQPTPLAGPKPPTNFLDGIVDFFRQYVMLIAVVGSLVFLLMFIVCAAVITRQKHKASAYYPSSFPKKKYVDQSDRAGGPRAFSEVPDRAPDGRPEEARDSSQQLQADILAATQNLKSPARATLGGGDGARMMEGKSEEEEKGTREVDQDAQGREVLAEEPDVPSEEPCPAEVAGEGQGEPEAAPLLAQETGAQASSPESPCACSSVSPSI
uniref:Transmembrane protein 119 n=1 Tax=Sus scrofa TaxID=9823 RepID=A0A8D1NRH4_PIG